MMKIPPKRKYCCVKWVTALRWPLLRQLVSSFTAQQMHVALAEQAESPERENNSILDYTSHPLPQWRHSRAPPAAD